jgi:hypothetical protein
VNKIIVDRGWGSKLEGVPGEVEVCSEDGETIGLSAQSREIWYKWAKSQFTPEELDNARRETGGRTLAEILADLEPS